MGRPLYAESVARSLWETACGRRGTATGGNNGLGGTPPHTHCPASGSGSLNTQKTSKCTQILTVHTHALCIMCSSSISEWCQKQIRRHSERRTHLSVFVYLGQSVCAVQTRSVQGVCVVYLWKFIQSDVFVLGTLPGHYWKYLLILETMRKCGGGKTEKWTFWRNCQFKENIKEKNKYTVKNIIN